MRSQQPRRARRDAAIARWRTGARWSDVVGGRPAADLALLRIGADGPFRTRRWATRTAPRRRSSWPWVPRSASTRTVTMDRQRARARCRARPRAGDRGVIQTGAAQPRRLRRPAPRRRGVVGINAAMFFPAQGLCFAVPSTFRVVRHRRSSATATYDVPRRRRRGGVLLPRRSRAVPVSVAPPFRPAARRGRPGTATSTGDVVVGFAKEPVADRGLTASSTAPPSALFQVVSSAAANGPRSRSARESRAAA